MIHGEGVGLCVEHPVFQGEHVIFREQKIEIPVPPGQGGKQDKAGEGTGEKGPTGSQSQRLPQHWAVAKGAGRFEIQGLPAALVPGKALWMLRRALRSGAVRPGLTLALPLAFLC